ncbi:Lrp/AsnC family transcriptional regulator [uncultured Lentibacter sp.]|uniref:Lrp/AsnC family transcriptional regulator n=1 Tax=uncultured Lentibacter sp. TaxID=1659309 RepID=UPI00261A7BE3|nr:Lrp/AsnC family transcriptional regulator [uncultured Lentibacter sp.]
MQNDETDTRLLALLAENARTPVVTLARQLGLARTTVQARIERLETTGAISGYTIRRGAGGRAALRATVLISIEPRSGPSVLARLKALSGVEQVHTTSGRWDLIAILSATTPERLDQTLDDIGAAKGVLSSESLIHLSTKIDRS